MEFLKVLINNDLIIIKKFIGPLSKQDLKDIKEIINNLWSLKFFNSFFSLFSFNHYASEPLNENKIHKNLRCLVCQGQSIADSNSDFATTLKIVVKDLIKKGKTEEEIYDFLSINMEIGFYTIQN